MKRFLSALKKQPVDKTPAWMMRQAGRYLPEYRELRAQVPDFLTFCKNPKMACEVTLQPLRRFPIDAAIIFSDILTIPDAMNIGLHFAAGEGPKVSRPVRSLEDVKKLKPVDVKNDLGYVFEALELVKQNLDASTALIGFAGSPWTVACYMVEGGGSKIFKHIKSMLYREPETLHALLQLLTDTTITYLSHQIEAGAEVVQVFDSWGGVLTGPAYQAFSLYYMQQITQALKANYPDTPVILFTKGGGQWLELLAEAECDALGLDWTVDLAEAKQRVGAQKTLQGNLDPMALFGSKDSITKEVERILSVYDGETGYVFNLGHGIDKDTPVENVAHLFQCINTQ